MPKTTNPLLLSPPKLKHTSSSSRFVLRLRKSLSRSLFSLGDSPSGTNYRSEHTLGFRKFEKHALNRESNLTKSGNENGPNPLPPSHDALLNSIIYDDIESLKSSFECAERLGALRAKPTFFLFMTLQQERTDVLKLLLNYPCVKHVAEQYAQDIIVCFSKYGELKALENFIENFPECKKKIAFGENRALRAAWKKRHFDVVQTLFNMPSVRNEMLEHARKHPSSYYGIAKFILQGFMQKPLDHGLPYRMIRDIQAVLQSKDSFLTIGTRLVRLKGFMRHYQHDKLTRDSASAMLWGYRPNSKDSLFYLLPSQRVSSKGRQTRTVDFTMPNTNSLSDRSACGDHFPTCKKTQKPNETQMVLRKKKKTFRK